MLDVRCGNFDLSRYVAGLAGISGEVVAIDRSEQALESAQTTKADSHAARIQYSAVDLSSDLLDLGLFDAIVGRRVLMYLRDAAMTLERLTALAKPSGIMAFRNMHELPFRLA